MSHRLAAVALALVLLALLGGGALGGVFADDTTGSGLVIDAADGANGEYADLSDDHLELDLSAGGGVSNDAVTHLDAVFVVTNDRSYEAPVWISDDSEALSFYDTDTGARVDAREDAENLTAGERLRVGVTVDLRDSDVEDVESTSEFAVETLVKDTTEDDPSDAPDPSDSPDTADPTDAPDDETSTTDDGDSTGGGEGGGNSGGGGGGGEGGAGGGGAGGGGGQSSGDAESEFRVYDTSEGATVNVHEAVAADPFTADLTGDDGASYVAGDDTDVTAFSADLTFDREDWRVELTTPTADPQSAPSVDGEAVSYFRVDAYGAEAAAFDSIVVNASVSVPDDASPADVTFYRHTDSGWRSVETSHHGDERFSAELGGFGEIAVVVDAGDGTDTGTGGDGNEGDGTDGDGDGTGGDGTDSDGTGGDGTDGDGQSGSAGTTSETDGGTDSDASPTGTEREQEPVPLDSGLGSSTVFVFGVFALWLAARGRVGGGREGL